MNKIAQEAPSLDSKHTASPPVLMSGQPSYPIAENIKYADLNDKLQTRPNTRSSIGIKVSLGDFLCSFASTNFRFDLGVSAS